MPNQPNIDNTLLAPNNEGSPSSAPANGPAGPGYDTSNFLHSNPMPVHRGARASRRCARPANEQFVVGKTTIGNVPGQTPTTLHYNTTTDP